MSGDGHSIMSKEGVTIIFSLDATMSRSLVAYLAKILLRHLKTRYLLDANSQELDDHPREHHSPVGF